MYQSPHSVIYMENPGGGRERECGRVRGGGGGAEREREGFGLSKFKRVNTRGEIWVYQSSHLVIYIYWESCTSHYEVPIYSQGLDLESLNAVHHSL